MTTAMPIPSGWTVTGKTVPLAQVRKSAGLTSDAISRAVKEGHIPVVGRAGPGRGRAYRVDLDTALLVLACGALCAAVGIGLMAALTALKEGRATLQETGSIVIPLNIAA
jgi:hypothetical protein